MPPVDTQLELLRQCLGLPSDDTTYDATYDAPRTNTTTVSSAELSFDVPVGFLLEPRLIYSISCKRKKDRKPCGITDVALTDDAQVLVADYLNKAVKIYDCVPPVGLYVVVRILSTKINNCAFPVQFFSGKNCSVFRSHFGLKL